MSGLPPIDQSLIPADVRNGSAKDKQTYNAALGFEKTLMDELTKAMAATAQPADDSDSSSDDGSGDDSSSLDQPDAATSMYMQMLPDQLTDGLMQGGGLGLARTFYDAMKDGDQ
jgi:Rod binding domain-containing protein